VINATGIEYSINEAPASSRHKLSNIRTPIPHHKISARDACRWRYLRHTFPRKLDKIRAAGVRGTS
jgi:hypothetical protein